LATQKQRPVKQGKSGGGNSVSEVDFEVPDIADIIGDTDELLASSHLITETRTRRGGCGCG